MSEFSASFERLLADRRGASSEGLWGEIEASGFLDLLRDERDGGAGAPLEEALPFALALGREGLVLPVVQTMIERVFETDVPPTNVPREALEAAVLAALMAGALQRVLGLSVDYANTRQQFGRPIGRFQAVQHQLAVMAEEVAAANTAAAMALRGTLTRFDPLRGALAKLRCGLAVGPVASGAHAVHGAIGISEDYELQSHTRRLRAWRGAGGADAWWARRLGEAALAGEGGFLELALAMEPA